MEFLRLLKFNPNHSPANGQFTSGSGTSLDQRLVDYKPDRSLSDPKGISEITELLPKVSHQAYSQVPFLEEMHQVMGTKDPLAIPVEKYMAARDKLFESLPTVEAPLDQLVVTQRHVNRERIQELRKDSASGGSKPVHAVRYEGKIYIMNGHHRIVAEALEGGKSFKAKLLSLPLKVTKFNPNHVPAGSPIGGQFTSRPAGGAEQLYERTVDRAATEEGMLLRLSASERALYGRVKATLQEHIAAGDETWIKHSSNPAAKLPGASQKRVYAYTDERRAIHRALIEDYKEQMQAFIPPKGVQPELIVLGGRGGSGKSFFHGNVFDTKKFMVLDPDQIKEALAKKAGEKYNPNFAYLWHKEAGEIFDKLVQVARKDGVNIVLDVTLRSNHDHVAKRYTESGYKLRGLYMHTAPQESAHRALRRFLGGGGKGRLVPPAIILGNKSNERNFDSMKRYLSDWEVWDNNTEGQPPKKMDWGSFDKSGWRKFEQILKFNPNHDPANGQFTSAAGPGEIFVSPNRDENVDLRRAEAKLGSGEQRRLREASRKVDRLLGLSGSTEDAIGAWADGAENSMVSTYRSAALPDLRVAAAMRGLLGEQKAVLYFRDLKSGLSRLTEMEIPGRSLSQAHAELSSAGVEFHTLVATTTGVKVIVFEERADAKMGRTLKQLAKAYGTQVVRRHGQGSFLGSWTSRYEGRRAYAKVLKDYFSTTQGKKVQDKWQGLLSGWKFGEKKFERASGMQL